MNVDELRALIKQEPGLVGQDIVVVGSGYVGLPLAILRTLQGATVHVVDIDSVKIAQLQAGIPPFYEVGLTEFLAEAIATGRIDFHTDLEPLVANANAIYSCVGTPPNDDGSANLTAVFSIGKQIGRGMVRGQRLLVIQTSTVEPGTTRALYYLITGNFADFSSDDCDLVIADRPEFLTQGYSFKDNLLYDRRVAAVFPRMPWARSYLMSIDHTYAYAEFVWVDSLETAEMIKYAANCMLATKISFGNLMALWAEAIGPEADVAQVMRAVGMDRRIGPWGLSTGIGFGGGCFPKDTDAAAFAMRRVGVDAGVISAAIKLNDAMPPHFAHRIQEGMGGLDGVVVACGGVTFKPGTDFVYPSQAVEVIFALLGNGATVRVYDPAGMPNFAKLPIVQHPDIVLCASVEEMLDGADCYALLTEWPELINIPIAQLHRLSSRKVFDGRNAMDKHRLELEGFTYIGVGRE